MSSPLSIELPAAVAHLVTPQAFDQYTIAGPARELESILRGLDADALFPAGVDDRQQAQCCLAGLWLLHNFLDLSHSISQEIHSREGSFWHAIMHRLEGDFWNSKYWYRKVGDHPVLHSMPGECVWDPEAYVDRCQAAERSGGSMAQSMQPVAVDEWKVLFEYCYNQATC